MMKSASSTCKFLWSVVSEFSGCRPLSLWFEICTSRCEYVIEDSCSPLGSQWTNRNKKGLEPQYPLKGNAPSDLIPPARPVGLYYYPGGPQAGDQLWTHRPLEDVQDPTKKIDRLFVKFLCWWNKCKEAMPFVGKRKGISSSFIFHMFKGC